MASTLTKEIIASLSDGTCNNPFAVLGLQKIRIKGKEKLVIRVFRPEAKTVKVVAAKKKYSLQRLSEAGLFEHVFSRRKNFFDYTLEAESHEGEVQLLKDPYAYDSLISDFDLQIWGEGNHTQAYEFMGVHPKTVKGVKGMHFVVTAPNADRISVIGSFNEWDGRVHSMRKLHDQGVWDIFIPEAQLGDLYKFEIKTSAREAPLKKSDPYAFYAEVRPGTASVVCDIEGYTWGDDEWLNKRDKQQASDQPISIYEVHLGSWKRKAGEEPGFLNYRELADELIPYVKETGFTHIELLPVAEHPYDPSWGYQLTGYYAPTSRFGTPEDFMYFIDQMHQAGIGVILDWVPAHFAKDDHGLRQFDGTGLYEHDDPRKGEHKDWGTCIFNYGRTEVINFLISNAMYWCEKYHVDGFRVDAVASMLYLDYSKEEGEWVPNEYGGRENLEAIDFLRRFNDAVHENYPGVVTFAEESTSWGGVSRPTETGGLGFDYKWNMGWMNDSLTYIEKDPVHRKYHQDQLTFSLVYAFTERFILPYSHDEVVHMKQSMLSKMPGDDWQKFANLRLIYTYMYTHPGKNLLFMGGEFGQWGEWSEDRSLDWHLLDWGTHKGIKQLVTDLNKLDRQEKALHEVDFDGAGFEWIDISDADNSIISFIRRAKDPEDFLVIILNFTPTVHYDYKIGVPHKGTYNVILNSDSEYYGGSNAGSEVVEAEWGEWHGQKAYIKLTIPPLAGVILKLKDISNS
ncbi:MAG: 1,4-alpha-glucan branching protein GlgB [Balneolaceae bacterium]|nr:1,4-alpha-glucan branching protein GlgB [Balneolaceae bacterium]